MVVVRSSSNHIPTSFWIILFNELTIRNWIELNFWDFLNIIKTNYWLLNASFKEIFRDFMSRMSSKSLHVKIILNRISHWAGKDLLDIWSLSDWFPKFKNWNSVAFKVVWRLVKTSNRGMKKSRKWRNIPYLFRLLYFWYYSTM